MVARDETVAGAAVRLASVLRDSYLPLQGPPGTGKTYTAAEQVLALVAQECTVGITGPSHAVILHLMTRCACTQPRRLHSSDRQNVVYAAAVSVSMPTCRNRVCMPTRRFS